MDNKVLCSCGVEHELKEFSKYLKLDEIESIDTIECEDCPICNEEELYEPDLEFTENFEEEDFIPEDKTEELDEMIDKPIDKQD